MEVVETMSLDRLWDQVGDMMEYFGCCDSRLSECRLKNGFERNVFVLQVPEDLIGLIADGVDEIEDALEQLLGEHRVDVYPVVIEVEDIEGLSAEELMCKRLIEQKE